MHDSSALARMRFAVAGPMPLCAAGDRCHLACKALGQVNRGDVAHGDSFGNLWVLQQEAAEDGIRHRDRWHDAYCLIAREEHVLRLGEVLCGIRAELGGPSPTA